MSNVLYQTMNKNANMGNLGQRIAELKKIYSGNPMDYVQKMLNSGQISQAQYDRAVSQAQEIIKGMR